MEREDKALSERVDTASRMILAPPRTLFRAFLDAEMLASWRAPEGMTARIVGFKPGIGGSYRIVLTYDDADASQGKSNAREDVADVRFLELVPDERIIEEVRFVSEDPRLAAPMTITTSIERVAGGTKVTFSARGVPDVIDPEDHKTGMASALRNLARLTE